MRSARPTHTNLTSATGLDSAEKWDPPVETEDNARNPQPNRSSESDRQLDDTAIFDRQPSGSKITSRSHSKASLADPSVASTLSTTQGKEPSPPSSDYFQRPPIHPSDDTSSVAGSDIPSIVSSGIRADSAPPKPLLQHRNQIGRSIEMVPEEGSSTRSKERQSAGSSTVSKGTASLEPAPPPSKPPSTQSLHRINRLERKESDDLSRFDLPKSMKESETRLTASSRDSGLAANASELRSAPLASSSTRHSEQNMVTVPSAAPLRDLGDRSRSASVASSANSSSAARSRRRQSRNGSAVSQSSSRRHADDFLKTPSLRGSGAIAYSKVHASVDDGSGYDNYDSYSSFGQEDWRGYEGLERAESSLQLDQEAGIVKETTLPEQKSRTSLRGSSDSIQKDKSGGFTSVTSRHSSQTSIVAHAINLDSPEPANFDSYIPSLAENPSKTAERSLSVNSRKSGSFASSVASASKVSRASRSSFNDGSFGDVADLQPETTDEGANAKQSHDGLIVRGSIGLDGANNNSTDFDSAIQSATADGLRQDLEDSKAFPENDESGKSLQGRYSVSSHESSSYSPSSQRQTLSVPCRGRFDTVTLPVPASPIVPALEAQFLAAGPTASSSTSVYSRLSEVVGSAAKQEDPHRPKIVVSASASQPRANDDSGTDDDSQRSGSGVRTDKFVDGFAPASNRFQSPISAFSLSMPSLCMTAPSGRIQSTEEETLASSRKSKSVSLRAMEQKSDRRARDDQDALQRRQEWLPTHHTKQTTAPQVSVTSPPIGAENSQRSNCDNDRDLLSKGSESVCEYEDAFTSGGSSRSSSPSFRKSSTRSSSRDSIPSPDFAYDKYDDDFSDMYSSGRSSDADFESRTVGHDDGAPREEDPFPVVEEFPVIDARDGTPRIPRSASSHSVDDAPFLRRKSGFAAPPPSHHVSQILSAANPQHVDARPRGRLSRSSTAASHAASTAASSTSAREPSHTSRELPSKSAKPSARTRAVRVEPARDEARSDGGKPPWRPNSKRTGTGWEYRKPTPKKATPPASPVLAHRGLSRSRTVTEDLESRPPFSAPVARKLHQAEKLPVTEEHTRRRAVSRQIEYRSLLTTKARSLTSSSSAITYSEQAEKRKRTVMPDGPRTFSNLPIEKGKRNTRGMDFNKKAKLPIAERVRKEMNERAKASRRFKGNWSSLTSKFVSQVKQPAWAEQQILPDPPPEPPTPSMVAKELEAKADAARRADQELQYRLGQLKKLTEAHGTFTTLDHVRALTKLALFWLKHRNTRESLRTALAAKSTLAALLAADRALLARRLAPPQTSSSSSSSSSPSPSSPTTAVAARQATPPPTLHQLLKARRYDAVLEPVRPKVKDAVRWEARVDRLIGAIVDARCRRVGVDGGYIDARRRPGERGGGDDDDDEGGGGDCARGGERGLSGEEGGGYGGDDDGVASAGDAAEVVMADGAAAVVHGEGVFGAGEAEVMSAGAAGAAEGAGRLSLSSSSASSRHPQPPPLPPPTENAAVAQDAAKAPAAPAEPAPAGLEPHAATYKSATTIDSTGPAGGGSETTAPCDPVSTAPDFGAASTSTEPRESALSAHPSVVLASAMSSWSDFRFDGLAGDDTFFD